MLRYGRGSLALVVLALGAALAYGASFLSSQRYVATGGVLTSAGMLKAQYAASDAQTAASLVQLFIETHKDPLLVDPPLVVRARLSLAENITLGLGLAGLMAL